MAVFLRRALSYRNILILNRSSHLSNSFYQSLFSPTLFECASAAPFNPPTLYFLKDARRGYAKGKKSKGDENDAELPVDFDDNVKSSAKSQMEAALSALSRELSKLRTGRASTGMLDHIVVHVDNEKTPLNRLAVISVLNSKTLSITPFDRGTTKEIEKAIASSPLGLEPKEDGDRLTVPIPELTTEHVEAMCKLISKCCEDVKSSIRRARQKAMDAMKKVSSQMPKDQSKKLAKDIDEVTKKFVKSVEDMGKSKEKEMYQT